MADHQDTDPRAAAQARTPEVPRGGPADPQRQIIVEGFVELLTVDCFTGLARSLSGIGSRGMLASLFEGVTGDPGGPDESLSEVGYGQAGQDAIKVRNLVGNDNVRVAFLPRRPDSIGLKPATQ